MWASSVIRINGQGRFKIVGFDSFDFWDIDTFLTDHGEFMIRITGHRAESREL